MENKGLKIIGLFSLLAIGIGRNADTLFRGCGSVARDSLIKNPDNVFDVRNNEEVFRSIKESFINTKGDLTEFKKKHVAHLMKMVENGSVTMDEITEFLHNVDDLKLGFGASNKITLEYQNIFLETQSLDEAKNSIIPIELKIDKGKNELFGLFTGQILNQEQAVLISKITKRKFNATPNKYYNYILMNSDIDGKVEVRTIHGIRENNTSDPFKKINISNKSKVIIKGAISKELIELCSKKNIRFIKPYSTFLKELNIIPDQIQFVLVASKNQTELKSSYKISDNQAAKLLKGIEQIEKREYFDIVNTEEKLTTVLGLIKAKGKYPVVIFNNVDNLLFGKKPSQIGISDFITCNSYRYKNTTNGYISTDFIYLEDILKSIDISKNRSFESADEFWNNVIKEYNNKLTGKLNLKITATAVIGTGVIGSGGYVIYYNINK
ncbi:hypothetical protein [Aquimarina spinulae]|uniref:hypothetical protein n=1 Tax=Aquimarina spinulae TaxID=1192023 RepID=UPI000D559DB0|nr:hypothetical protein [Aquimarina spinulae]